MRADGEAVVSLSPGLARRQPRLPWGNFAQQAKFNYRMSSLALFLSSGSVMQGRIPSKIKFVEGGMLIRFDDRQNAGKTPQHPPRRTRPGPVLAPIGSTCKSSVAYGPIQS